MTKLIMKEKKNKDQADQTLGNLRSHMCLSQKVPSDYDKKYCL